MLMTKINVKSNKTAIMTSILTLALLSSTFVFTNVGAVNTELSTTASGDVLSPECAAKARAIALDKADQFDENKASSLAANSSDLAEKTTNLKKTLGGKLDKKYDGISYTWTIDEATCEPSLTKVSATYLLNDKSGTVKRVAIVTMDPQLNKIEKIEYFEPKFAATGYANAWSGYDFTGNAAGTNTVTATSATFRVPIVSKPSTDLCYFSNTGHTTMCDMTMWTGLTDSLGGQPTNNLIQAGAEGVVACNSSGGACTTTYNVWHEELPGVLIPITSIVVNANDQIQVDISRRSSPTSTYDTVVRDGTQMSTSTKTGYAMTNPTRADFINERTKIAFSDGTKALAPLPQFTTATMSGSMSYGGTSHLILEPYQNGWFTKIILTSNGQSSGTVLIDTSAVSTTTNTYTETYRASK